jgi:hypothetical protein
MGSSLENLIGSSRFEVLEEEPSTFVMVVMFGHIRMTKRMMKFSGKKLRFLRFFCEEEEGIVKILEKGKVER